MGKLYVSYSFKNNRMCGFFIFSIFVCISAECVCGSIWNKQKKNLKERSHSFKVHLIFCIRFIFDRLVIILSGFFSYSIFNICEGRNWIHSMQIDGIKIFVSIRRYMWTLYVVLCKILVYWTQIPNFDQLYADTIIWLVSDKNYILLLLTSVISHYKKRTDGLVAFAWATTS